MLAQMFRGLQFLHTVLLALCAVGFFVFWARTRFWLPKYAHILAAMSLAVALGLFSVSNPPVDAPINRGGQITKFLFVLTFPAIVYFFFVFYGGQRACL
jgi:hypothetical protein